MHEKRHHARYLLSSCLLALLGSASLPGQSSTSFDRALQAETDPRKVADLIWSTVLTRCGDSAFTFSESQSLATLTEHKKPTFKIEVYKVSPAQHANGLEWSGQATLHAIRHRYIYMTWKDGEKLQPWGPNQLEWSPWEDPRHDEDDDVWITFWRKNGRWIVHDFDPNDRKFSCADATAKEPFARYKLPTIQEVNRREAESKRRQAAEYQP